MISNDTSPSGTPDGQAPEASDGQKADRRIAALAEIDPRAELLSLTPADLERELSAYFEERGEPAYRVEQVVRALYGGRAPAASDITTLPARLREDLDARYRFASVERAETRTSTDGTVKVLWRLVDGESIESVHIPSSSRDTFCISSQVGCALACSFCATGMLGYRRNLTTGEIVDQVRGLLSLRESPEHGVNIVFMGMGEPMLNWPRVRDALTILTDPRGFDIGSRRITVSTVGFPERIVALGDQFPQVRLAVSLHAARDEVRDEIVPLNRRHPLRELLAACRVWSRTTGKIMTFEYIHLPGVNDRDEDVAALAAALEGLPAKINLMAYNPVPGAPYKRPRPRASHAFRDRLRAATSATVTLRKSRGMDIEGACGQLRLARKTEETPAETP